MQTFYVLLLNFYGSEGRFPTAGIFFLFSQDFTMSQARKAAACLDKIQLLKMNHGKNAVKMMPLSGTNPKDNQSHYLKPAIKKITSKTLTRTQRYIVSET